MYCIIESPEVSGVLKILEPPTPHNLWILKKWYLKKRLIMPLQSYSQMLKCRVFKIMEPPTPTQFLKKMVIKKRLIMPLQSYSQMLRGVALVVILLRAGLGLDPVALRRLRGKRTRIFFNYYYGFFLVRCLKLFPSLPEIIFRMHKGGRRRLS